MLGNTGVPNDLAGGAWEDQRRNSQKRVYETSVQLKIHISPNENSSFTGSVLEAGQTFEVVCLEGRADNNPNWLMLDDGRGWVHTPAAQGSNAVKPVVLVQQ